MPFWIDHPLETVEQLQQFTRVAVGLPVNGRVINGDTALGHHLLQVAQAVSQVPSDAQQDYRAVEMAAFEYDAPPEPARGVRRTQLPTALRSFERNSFQEFSDIDNCSLKQKANSTSGWEDKVLGWGRHKAGRYKRPLLTRRG
jgi:hypothetical protein